MTIKLLLLKSGEDMIADVKEMAFGEDEEREPERAEPDHPVDPFAPGGRLASAHRARRHSRLPA